MKYYGKEKCRILKEIRAEIARQNDIEWVVSECKHQGNCKGTCPKCEQEVRELEKALARREALGKKVAVVGVSASIALSVTGCANPLFRPTAGVPMPPDAGEPLPSNTESESVYETASQGEEVVTEMGELIVPGGETESEDILVEGEVPEETTGVEIDVVLPGVPVLDETETDEPLMGDPVPEEDMTEMGEPAADWEE